MDRSIRIKRRQAWLIALGMTGALFAVAALWMKVIYPINDDVSVMREVMGYSYGEPAAFQLFTHAFLLWPLRLLHAACPTVTWYTWLQLALVFVSLAVIAKSVMQCFLIHEKPLWMGTIFSAAFLVAFGFEYAARPTFTHTSALLGAASAAQLLSVDYQRLPTSRALMGALGSAVLMSLCYCIRSDVLMPALPYGALAFVYLLWKHGKIRIRLVLLSLFIALAVLAATFGVRLWELSDGYVKKYTEWDVERGKTMDYHYNYLYSLPPEQLDMIGWDGETLSMVYDWFFLDPSVDTQALRNINDYFENVNARTAEEHLQGAKELFKKRLHNNPREIGLYAIFAAAGFVSLLAALFRKGSRVRLLFVLGCIAGGCGFMLFYLAWQGRMPIRAVITVVVPAIAMTLCVLPDCFPSKRAGKLLLCLSAAAVLVCTAIHSGPFLSGLATAETPAKSAYEDLEEYALDHPDSLFIADVNLSRRDYRAFPNYSDGIPTNISYWGGWDLRSPGSAALFDRFGIDVWEFDPETFLREDVFLAAASDAPLPQFMNWLTKKTAKDITWDVIAHEGGIYILHFRENGGNK